MLSANDLDQLALEGNETIGYKGGRIASYDVAGYERLERRETPPFNVLQREIPPAGAAMLLNQARFSRDPYLLRIGGFRRADSFGPDQIGALIRQHNIPWNDGLGNGLYESLLINRKYGLRLGVEAPSLGLRPVYLESELEPFHMDYANHVREMRTRFKELEAVSGWPLLEGADAMLAVVHEDSPFGLFVQALERVPQALQAEMKSVLGFSAPPVNPQTVAERGGLARFWAFVRRKQAQIIEARLQVLRMALGPRLIVVANFHEQPHLDLEYHGRIYDYPAVAVRPLLIEDKVMLRHYIPYWVQLFKDLSGKPPLVSIRNNLSAVGARFVPGPELNRLWYDQAVRHGAGGFYLWPRDYPMDSSEPYDGAMCANPEPNTLPEIRWQANLQAFKRLGAGGRFMQPAPQVAILVPHQTNLLTRQDWRRIYSAFSAAAEAQVHCGFISDVQVEAGGFPAAVRLLLVPHLEIVPAGLRVALEQYIARGGVLLSSGQPLFDEHFQPIPNLSGARKAGPELFELFPLGEQGSLARLRKAAKLFSDYAKLCNVDPQAWLFQLGLEHLPPVAPALLRPTDSEIEFRHYMYEHGSNWIYPYIYP